MPSSAAVIIGLYDPKSPSNVGAVLRAAGCYQASEVRYTGTRFDRAVKYQTDTTNAKNRVPLVHYDDLLIDLPVGTKIICVELAEAATQLPSFEHPDHVLYLFGPEDGSIPQSIIDKSDDVIYVPTIGCMNLAASVNVLLYDRLAKANRGHDQSYSVRKNRDANNRLRVKRDTVD